MRSVRWILRLSLVLGPLGLYAACASPKPVTNEPTSATAAATRVVRGPTSLDFDPAGNGDPISIVWHDPSATLYIADNRNDQIWTWTDAAGFKKLVTLPSDPAAADAGQSNLGQIVRLADGSLVVPRFGFGKNGAIVHVN